MSFCPVLFCVASRCVKLLASGTKLLDPDKQVLDRWRGVCSCGDLPDFHVQCLFGSQLLLLSFLFIGAFFLPHVEASTRHTGLLAHLDMYFLSHLDMYP